MPHDLDPAILNRTNIHYEKTSSFLASKTNPKAKTSTCAQSDCRRLREDLASDSEVRLCLRVQRDSGCHPEMLAKYGPTYELNSLLNE